MMLIFIVNHKECIIYSGDKFTIEWYYDKNEKSVVNEFFMDSTEELQDKFLILVKKLVEIGKIFDTKNSVWRYNDRHIKNR
jgi:hypothetical protein